MKLSSKSNLAMKEILDYLYNLKKVLIELCKNNNISVKYVLVLGNEACDMDSVISSIFISYLKNIESNFIKINKKLKKVEFNTQKLDLKIYIPVINCKENHLFNRFDIELLFNKINLNKEILIYFENLVFKNINSGIPYLNINENKIKINKDFGIILVDHFSLSLKQEFLKDYITEIYDHHNDEGFNFSEYKNLKEKHIEYPRCSAINIILEEFINKYNNIDEFIDNISTDEKNNFVDMIVCTQIIDSRWESKDKEIVFKLIDKLKYSKILNKNIETYSENINDKDINLYSNKNKDDISYQNHKDILENHSSKSREKVDKMRENDIKDIYEILKKAKVDEDKNLSLSLKDLFKKDMKTYMIEGKDLTVLFSVIIVKFDKLKTKYSLKNLKDFMSKITKNKSDIVVAFVKTGEEKGCLFIHSLPEFIKDKEKIKKYEKHLNEKLDKESIGECYEEEDLFIVKGSTSRKVIWPIIKQFIQESV